MTIKSGYLTSRTGRQLVILFGFHVRLESRYFRNADIYKKKNIAGQIQGVPGVKVTTSGVTSLGDAESQTSYIHGSNSQRFMSYEVWKKLDRKEEQCAFIEKYS
jgi:hypothetical protein